MGRKIVIEAVITGAESGLLGLELSQTTIGQQYDDNATEIRFTRPAWAEGLRLHLRVGLTNDYSIGEYPVNGNKFLFGEEITSHDSVVIQCVFYDNGVLISHTAALRVNFARSIKPPEFISEGPGGGESGGDDDVFLPVINVEFANGYYTIEPAAKYFVIQLTEPGIIGIAEGFTTNSAVRLQFEINNGSAVHVTFDPGIAITENGRRMLGECAAMYVTIYGSLTFSPVSGLWTCDITNYKPHVLNVRDYGVFGDNAAENAAAVQTAYEHASENNLMLYFPAGTYKLSGLKFARDGSRPVMFLGESRETAILEDIENLWVHGNLVLHDLTIDIGNPDDYISPLFQVDLLDAGKYSDIHLRNIAIKSRNRAQTTSSLNYIHAECADGDGTSRGLGNVSVVNCSFSTALIAINLLCHVKDLFVDNSTFANLGHPDNTTKSPHGIFAGYPNKLDQDSESPVENAVITNCVIRNLKAAGADGNPDYKPDSMRCAGMLIYANSLIVVDTVFEDFFGHRAFGMYSKTPNLLVRGCRFHNAAAADVLSAPETGTCIVNKHYDSGSVRIQDNIFTSDRDWPLNGIKIATDTADIRGNIISLPRSFSAISLEPYDTTGGRRYVVIGNNITLTKTVYGLLSSGINGTVDLIDNIMDIKLDDGAPETGKASVIHLKSPKAENDKLLMMHHNIITYEGMTGVEVWSNVKNFHTVMTNNRITTTESPDRCVFATTSSSLNARGNAIKVLADESLGTIWRSILEVKETDLDTDSPIAPCVVSGNTIEYYGSKMESFVRLTTERGEVTDNIFIINRDTESSGRAVIIDLYNNLSGKAYQINRNKLMPSEGKNGRVRHLVLFVPPSNNAALNDYQVNDNDVTVGQRAVSIPEGQTLLTNSFEAVGNRVITPYFSGDGKVIDTERVTNATFADNSFS